MNRRHFIAAAAPTIAAPFVKAQGKTSLNGAIIGHGGPRYRVDLEWCKAKREVHAVKDCHEMVMDGQKRLIMGKFCPLLTCSNTIKHRRTCSHPRCHLSHLRSLKSP